MEVQVAAAKVGKYATSESGDTLEMIERPLGGVSFVLADGQSSGRGAKRISNLAARKAISLLAEVGLDPHTKAAQLFLALFQRLGQLVSDAELGRAVWLTEDAGGVKHALELAVAELRKKLRRAQAPYRVVRKYGQGYRLEHDGPHGAGDA